MDFEKNSLSKNILISLGMVGVLSAALIAPGLVKLLPYLQKVELHRINQEIKRLQKRGMVEIFKAQNGLSEIRLSEKGRKKLQSFTIDSVRVSKIKPWDGMWRMVIFDIPISKNSLRNILRKKMRMLGFYRLQQSVFIHAYPCFEVVEYLRSYLEVKDEVEYVEVSKMERQNKLIEFFFT